MAPGVVGVHEYTTINQLNLQIRSLGLPGPSDLQGASQLKDLITLL